MEQMTVIDWLIQGVGVLGIIATITAFQCKGHYWILFWRSVSALIFVVQYFLLGAYTGVAMDFLGVARNFLFAELVRRGKRTWPWVLVFTGVFITAGALTWQGWASLFIIAAKLISNAGYGSKNTFILRLMSLLTSVFWLIYNAYVFTLAGIACEGFAILSILVGIVRFDLLPKLKCAETERR